MVHPILKAGLLTCLLSLSLPILAKPAASWSELLTELAQTHPQAAARLYAQKLASAYQQQSKQHFSGPKSLNLEYQSDALGSKLGVQNWSIGLHLPLQSAQTSRLAGLLSEGQGRSAQLQETLTKLELAGQLREIYWQTAQAQLEVSLAEKAVNLWRQQLQLLNERVKSGEQGVWVLQGLMLEKTKAESALLQAKQQVSNWQAQAHSLGVKSDLPQLNEQVAAQPLDDHPILQWLALQLNQARQQASLQLEAEKGQSALGLAYKQEAEDAAATKNSVWLSYSMPFGEVSQINQVKNMEQTFRLEVEQAQTRRDLELALGQLKRQQQELDAQWQLLNATRAQQSLSKDSFLNAFLNGRIGLADWLNAQVNQLALVANTEKTQLARRAMQSRLNQALGVLPQ